MAVLFQSGEEYSHGQGCTPRRGPLSSDATGHRPGGWRQDSEAGEAAAEKVDVPELIVDVVVEEGLHIDNTSAPAHLVHHALVVVVTGFER